VTATGTTISFERLTGAVGASVHGVDLHDPPGAEYGEPLRAGLAEHGVLFFRSEPPVTDEEFQTLGELFGESFAWPYRKNRSGPPSAMGRLEYESSAEASQKLVDRWHTDGPPMASPPYAALLTPDVLPRLGGDTLWASMSAAFDALSPQYQRLLEGMEAVHT